METRIIGRTALRTCELGFGGASIEFAGDPAGDDRAAKVLETAWQAGIRHFDTAPHYGLGVSERRTGRFLKTKPRDSFTVSTKVGRLIVDTDNGPDRVFDYSYDGIMRSHAESLERLGLDRVDILFVHDIALDGVGPNGRNHMHELLTSGWRALEELRGSGAISAFGLGVNEVEVCIEIMKKAALDVILLAGRYSLLDPQANEELIGRCLYKGTSFVLAGVFNTGILATGAVPGARYQYRPASEAMLEKTRKIEAVCREFGVPLPAAALQFAKYHPVVSTILVAAQEPAKLQANLENYRFPIPQAFWLRLAELGLAHHYSVDVK